MSNTTYLFKSFAHQSGNTSLRKRSRLVTTSVKQVDLQIDAKYIQPLTFELRQDTIYASYHQSTLYGSVEGISTISGWFEGDRFKVKVSLKDFGRILVENLCGEADCKTFLTILTSVNPDYVEKRFSVLACFKQDYCLFFQNDFETKEEMEICENLLCMSNLTEVYLREKFRRLYSNWKTKFEFEGRTLSLLFEYKYKEFKEKRIIMNLRYCKNQTEVIPRDMKTALMIEIYWICKYILIPAITFYEEFRLHELSPAIQEIRATSAELIGLYEEENLGFDKLMQFFSSKRCENLYYVGQRDEVMAIFGDAELTAQILKEANKLEEERRFIKHQELSSRESRLISEFLDAKNKSLKECKIIFDMKGKQLHKLDQPGANSESYKLTRFTNSLLLSVRDDTKKKSDYYFYSKNNNTYKLDEQFERQSIASSYQSSTFEPFTNSLIPTRQTDGGLDSILYFFYQPRGKFQTQDLFKSGLSDSQSTTASLSVSQDERSPEFSLIPIHLFTKYGVERKYHDWHNLVYCYNNNCLTFISSLFLSVKLVGINFKAELKLIQNPKGSLSSDDLIYTDLMKLLYKDQKKNFDKLAVEPEWVHKFKASVIVCMVEAFTDHRGTKERKSLFLLANERSNVLLAHHWNSEWKPKGSQDKVCLIRKGLRPVVLHYNLREMSYRLVQVWRRKIKAGPALSFCKRCSIKLLMLNSMSVDYSHQRLRFPLNSSTYDDKVPQVWIVDMKVKL